MEFESKGQWLECMGFDEMSYIIFLYYIDRKIMDAKRDKTQKYRYFPQNHQNPEN